MKCWWGVMSNFIKDLPTGWVSTRLGDLYSFEYGKSLTKGSRNSIGRYPVFGSSGIVGMHDQFLIEGPAIIVGRKGAAGSVSYSTDNLWPIDTTYYVRNGNNLYLKFSYYLLRSLNLEKLEASTAIPGLNRNHVYDEIVLLPPLSEQHRIVAKIEELFSELDKGIENLKTAQAQLKVYRQALLKHAFEGKLTAQWRAQRRAKQTVAPAQAGAQLLNDMDSRPTPSRGQAMRGNDEAGSGNDEPLETAEALLKRIQQERAQRYQQQLAEWEKSPSIPLLQRGKPTSTAPIPPLEKGGRGGISKPKPPKSLPPLTAEELAELPELPEGWGWVKVGTVSSVGTGITPLKGRSDFYANGNIPWVTSGALNDNFVTEASDYVTDLALKETNLRIYPKHTLLIALYGEGKTRGKCSELLIEAATNQAIAAIVQEGMLEKLRKYMKWFFQKNYGDIRLKSSGGVQSNLNLSIIENTLFPMCSIEEANQVVDAIEMKLSEIDQLDQTITTSLQQAEALRPSILKKAFSGQLVPQDPNDEPASELLARIKAERLASQGNLVVRRKGGRS